MALKDRLPKFKLKDQVVLRGFAAPKALQHFYGNEIGVISSYTLDGWINDFEYGVTIDGSIKYFPESYLTAVRKKK